MVDSADGTVGSNDDGDDEEGNCDDDQGVFVAEAYGQDAAGELPGADVEGVGDPVCFTLLLVFRSIGRAMGAAPMKLMLPQLRWFLGTGSRSRFVHRAFPAANVDSGRVTCNRGRFIFIVNIYIYIGSVEFTRE
jgi:hypothetical protein